MSKGKVKVEYYIVCNYETGNSFGREDAVEQIEIPFTNIDTVYENIKRFKEHIRFYEMLNDVWSYERNELGWTDDKILSEWKKKDWAYTEKRDDGSERVFEFSCKMLLDNGKEFIMHTPWIGYFEKYQNFEVKTIFK